MAKERAGLFVLLGLTGLGVGAAALASASPRKPSVDIGPGRIIPRPDWSGCGTPPEWCLPAPKYKCGDSVYVDLDGFVKGRVYRIIARTWGQTPGESTGLWIYGLVDPSLPATDTSKTLGTPSEESNLSPAASPVVKQVAQVLAPTATPVAPKTVASAPVKATVAPVTAQQEAAMDLPLYPQGLIVSKGSVEGVVVAIGKQADGYHYKIKAGIGPFQQDYSGSESYVMDMLAEKTGQKPYGFAFPAGVTLKMKNYKVNIIERKLNNGVLSYGTDQGDIMEPALIVRLYQAQRG
jgi:hypothetical protein